MIKIVLALAFADRAFASPHISKAADIYNIRVPDRLESVPIEWASIWKGVPLLRRTVRDTNGIVRTSLSEAVPYNQILNWNRRLGRSFGMKTRFEFKMLRRAAAAALTGLYLSDP